MNIDQLNTLVQGGSFAVIVFLIAAVVWYWPRLRRETNDREDRREAERQVEGKRRDEAYERSLQKMVDVNTSMATVFREDIRLEREACSKQYGLILDAIGPLRMAIDRQSNAIDAQTRILAELQQEVEAAQQWSNRQQIPKQKTQP